MEIKHCKNCGAAQDTAKLWKLKCTAPRHQFIYERNNNE